MRSLYPRVPFGVVSLHLLVGLVLVVLPWMCVRVVAAQGESSVRLVVWDAQNHPVAGLTLTLATDGAAPQTLQTDATGTAKASGLAGPFFRITAAQQADGTRVPIDATTLDEGLRLGLVPGQQRTVLLRLDQNLLFVDPETIFAGTDSPPTLATAAAQATQAAAAVVSSAPSGVDGGTQRGAASSSEHGWPRWMFGLVVVGVIGVVLLLAGVRALLQARTQAGRVR